MEKQALLKITGKVQGVFYRANATKEAYKLGLKGYASNMGDGSVEVLLQGDEEQIKQFIDWAKEGPDKAKVEEVNINWTDLDKEKKFENFKTY